MPATTVRTEFALAINSRINFRLHDDTCTILSDAENFYKRTHSALSLSSFKCLRNRYHKLILASKKNYFSNLVSSSSENPRRLWQTVNKLLRRKCASPLPE